MLSLRDPPGLARSDSLTAPCAAPHASPEGLYTLLRIEGKLQPANDSCPREGEEDTGCALRPAHQVETSGYHVSHLATTRQVLAHGHLEEVEGCVQAVLVQLKLVAQVVDLPLTWREKHTPTHTRLCIKGISIHSSPRYH